MKRKLVRQGAATMMVSLPASWIKQSKLGKGSEVDIDIVGKDLLVSAKGKKMKSETEIRLSGLREVSVRTLITNTYRSGHDKIKVLFENEKQFKILNEVIKTRLIGFDIVKKEKDYCIVENITEPSADQFDVIIKKIFFNISEFFEITKRRMAGLKEDYGDVAERVQKYDNFCRRIIFKRKVVDQNSEYLWSFLVLMVHATRELYHLNQILDKKTAVSPRTKEFFNDAKNVFELVKEAYFEKKPELLAKIHDSEKELIYKKGFSLLKLKEGPAVYHIIATIRNFHLSTSPLSGLIM